MQTEVDNSDALHKVNQSQKEKKKHEVYFLALTALYVFNITVSICVS